MTDRIPLDDLTSDALDALYTELAEAQATAAYFDRQSRRRRQQLQRVQELADEHPACIDTALILAALDTPQETRS